MTEIKNMAKNLIDVLFYSIAGYSTALLYIVFISHVEYLLLDIFVNSNLIIFVSRAVSLVGACSIIGYSMSKAISVLFGIVLFGNEKNAFIGLTLIFIISSAIDIIHGSAGAWVLIISAFIIATKQALPELYKKKKKESNK